MKRYHVFGGKFKDECNGWYSHIQSNDSLEVAIDMATKCGRQWAYVVDLEIEKIVVTGNDVKKLRLEHLKTVNQFGGS